MGLYLLQDIYKMSKMIVATFNHKYQRCVWWRNALKQEINKTCYIPIKKLMY